MFIFTNKLKCFSSKNTNTCNLLSPLALDLFLVFPYVKLLERVACNCFFFSSLTSHSHLNPLVGVGLLSYSTIKVVTSQTLSSVDFSKAFTILE